jgi:hypothetical protein
VEDGLNWLDVVFVASFNVFLGHRAGGVEGLSCICAIISANDLMGNM